MRHQNDMNSVLIKKAAVKSERTCFAALQHVMMMVVGGG
jgi:hypothetical protein